MRFWPDGSIRIDEPYEFPVPASPDHCCICRKPLAVYVPDLRNVYPDEYVRDWNGEIVRTIKAPAVEYRWCLPCWKWRMKGSVRDNCESPCVLSRTAEPSDSPVHDRLTTFHELRPDIPNTSEELELEFTRANIARYRSGRVYKKYWRPNR